MKTKSRAASFSLVLAILGILLVQTRNSLFLVVAMLLGMGAVATGVLALWSIRKARGSLRGKGSAIFGICLGGGATVLSQFVLVVVLFNQAQLPRQSNWQPPPIPNPMPAKSVEGFTSNLPLVVLDTAGQSVHKSRDTLAQAKFFAVESGRASLGGKIDYEGPVTIHYRGFSSLRLPKRSYTLNTVDRNSKQVEVSLLGLPKDEDWVLYAPFEDKTLMRDVLAYELSNKMGRYAPRTRYVELFVKTSNSPLSMRDYAGVYVLVEKIKRGKNRVNIQKLEPGHKSEPELTGGYIIKRDHNEDQGSRFHTHHGGPFFYVYPKAEDISSAQKAWIGNYLNAFESALYGGNFQDPQTGYAAYLDVDSFIDAHWLVELSKNVDGFRYSAFLSKDRGGKLKLEPPWDWNRSFGNANYYGGYQVQNWYYHRLRPTEICWYRRLSEDPAFKQRCRDRWLELRKDALDTKRILARVDELAAELEEAQDRNFERWPILGQHITCNYYVGHTFKEEVNWMKNWIERRIAWIDGQMEKD